MIPTPPNRNIYEISIKYINETCIFTDPTTEYSWICYNWIPQYISIIIKVITLSTSQYMYNITDGKY